ncbi:MAG: cobalamin biosynthesis protein CbiD [Clostridia bacterium]|nr:cobalamin biosynthesis protein CbiD [Clostridia bacterium]
MMDSFITKNGKKMRRGFTTGSCAAAAAGAAAFMLLEKTELQSIYLKTPAGMELTLPVQDIVRAEDFVSCAVVKDSGDDPDVTNGIAIYAKVEKMPDRQNIFIDGGIGIGRVTKPGLDQPVGNAAINSTPRRMIKARLQNICEDCGYTGGLNVTIFTPQGEEIAKKTFNSRLGIEGGISILGTTGIVEPMSDAAVIETIRAELSVRAAEGKKAVLFTPGNYGSSFVQNTLELPPEVAVICSNFIGDAFSLAEEAGFEYALLAGHIGKVVKLSAGMFNTHSSWGDGRAEIFAAHAGACGADAACVQAIMGSATTDDMLHILEKAHFKEAVMQSILGRIEEQLERKTGEKLQTGVITFSNICGTLGSTRSAAHILKIIQQEYYS